MLGAAGFFFFRAQLRSLTDQAAGLDAVEGARAALDFMANDIRTASLKPTGSCATCGAGLSNARSDTITVAWDANSNGTLDATESITYAYNSSAKTVTRTIDGTTTTLISNVPSGGLSFQYLQSDGSAAAMSGSPAAVTTPANVTTVLVTVQVQANEGDEPVEHDSGEPGDAAQPRFGASEVMNDMTSHGVIGGERGSSMVFALLVLFAILTLGVAGLSGAGFGVTLSNNYRTGVQAEQAAESGLIHTVKAINNTGGVVELPDRRRQHRELELAHGDLGASRCRATRTFNTR